MMDTTDFFRSVRYVTLKLTNGCNLKCSYCNVEALTPQTPRMSIDRFKQIANLLLENSQSPSVGLEFHGGEPLLMEDSWFEEATGYARELARKHHKMIEFPLVTNGTMLSAERLDYLTKLGIRFCLSCDGPPEINDIFRQAGHAVERALKLFVDARIYTGLITVLSRSNYDRMTEVMDWYRDIGIHDFRVNVVQPQGRGMDADLLTGVQHFEGMRQVLDHMVDTDVSVNEADTMKIVERFIEGREHTCGQLSCWEVECQAGRTYVAITLDGTMHACGTDLIQHPIGHLDQPFDEQRYRDVLQELHHKSDWVLRCFDCAAKQICSHSCPTSDYNSEQFKENECQFTKLLWNHLCENPEKAEHIYEIHRQRRQPAPGAFVPVSQLEMAQIT